MGRDAHRLGNGSIAQRQDGVEVDEDVFLCKAILEIFIEDSIGKL